MTLNASSYLNNRNFPSGRDEDGKARRPPFRYNNFGFTIGGPVYFLNFGELDPETGVFGKMKRTYFFFSEEQRRDRRFPTLVAQRSDRRNAARYFFSTCLFERNYHRYGEDVQPDLAGRNASSGLGLYQPNVGCLPDQYFPKNSASE